MNTTSINQQLIDACHRGDLPEAQTLIHVHGAQVTAREASTFVTPLHMAVVQGHTNIVQWLLEWTAILSNMSTTTTTTTTTSSSVLQQQFTLADPSQPLPVVLYQDDNLLVMDKPAGISHHNDDDRHPGILTLVRHHIDDGRLRLSPNNHDVRLYGVHRLDKVTSGILLLAKNAATAKVLTQAFQRHALVKYYTGLSFGKPQKKKQGWVQGWLYRGRCKSWMLATEPTKTTAKTTTTTTQPLPDNTTIHSNSNSTVQNGLFCKTRFFTAGLGHLSSSLSSSSSSSYAVPKTLLWFRPYTGRTHQLRVTAKSVGLALAGDDIYAGNHKGNHKGGISRTCLHATALYLPPEIVRALPQRQEDGDGDGDEMRHHHVISNHNNNTTTNTWAMDEDGGITIWSTPPFGTYYEASNDCSSSSSSSWNETLMGLLDKHCGEFPQLQALARRALVSSP